MRTFSRTQFSQKIGDTMLNASRHTDIVSDTEVPAELLNWMSRLQLLKGVPFNYLVPDEQMLPPESIRFFYLDPNWIDALTDGAFSLGRNLTTAASPALLIDQAVSPNLNVSLDNNLTSIRARALGVEVPEASLKVVSGFLLRSSLVLNYPGLGVNAYPQDGTPTSPNIQLLNILRLEQLGPESDTMICLIDGDAWQIDIHEAPEALHYGIDSYAAPGQGNSIKMLHTFTQSGSTVTMNPQATPMNINACFRTVSPRVIMMNTLAAQIANMNAVPNINSAEMGFEMTQGVGNVSFINSNASSQ
jgi:hypothetical protein